MSDSGIANVSTAVGTNRGAEPPKLVPALTIVSHPVSHRVGEQLVLAGLATGKEVGLSRNAPDFVRPGRSLGAPLGDPFVSRRPIWLSPTMVSASGSSPPRRARRDRTPGLAGIRLAASAGGTQFVLGPPGGEAGEVSIDDVATGVPIELADRVVLLLHLVEREGEAGGETYDMVGHSAGIQRVRAAIERVVDLSVPVLIRGETGTGKELVARAIHHQSPLRAGPFVSVNLGAIPRELAAAELFGAMRGAYTGATRDRDGLFRTAHGGTLFLDEIGEAPPEVQAMLLRVLETGEVYPVGAERPIATSVRLIAATDANLEDHIRDGRFKAPLLFRLSGYEVRLPPLRERREDIGPLFYHFAREELEAIGEARRLAPDDVYAKPWLPAQIAAQLVRHPWPGNIRQLRNFARQIVIGSRGLDQAHLDPRLADELVAPPPPRPAATKPTSGPPRRKASEVSEQELLAALQGCAWDLKAAAEQLGIPRPSMYDLIDKSPVLRTAGDLGTDEIAACFRECRGDLDAMVARLRVSKRALNRRIKELGLVFDE